jgi:cell wall-associated NlpC family hydrolase
MPELRARRGQAAVELLALLPLIALAAVVGWQVVAAAHAWGLASDAARRGARAAVVGAPARAAALAALPGTRADALEVERMPGRRPHGVRVRVTLRGRPTSGWLGPLAPAEVEVSGIAAGKAPALETPGAASPALAPPALAARSAESGLGPRVGAEALAFLGTPYRWGGADPSGFDCSGFVWYLYGRHGVSLPRVAEDQARVGVPVARNALRPGDAVFFADAAGYIHHEGIYLGAGRFVHAPHTGDAVKISSLASPYYVRQYAGARRY